jgi:hemolysin D
LAKIEEAIPAQGKLEPRGAVQPVQAPVGGVVDSVKVGEGETVEAGQVLITLNPSDTEARAAVPPGCASPG